MIMINAGSKILGASAVGVGSFAFNSFAQVSSPDDSWTLWLDKYGLPLVMLTIVLYVAKILYKALRESEKARIEDKERSLQEYIEESRRQQEHREVLIGKMDEQTLALKDATREMSKTSPCPYKPK